MQGCVDCHDALDKTFCGSMDGGAGRSIMSRKDTHRPRIYTYFSGDTYLLPLWWKRSNVINPPTGGWLGLLRNGAVSGAQSWSPSSAGYTLSSGCGQVSLQEKKTMFCPCPASMPATTATWFISSVSKPSGGRGKKLIDIHRLHHFVQLTSSLWALIQSWLFTSSPNFLTTTPPTHGATTRNSQEPLFSCNVSPAPSTGEAQHCAHCKGQMFKWILSITSEHALTDEFAAMRQYIDNWHGFLTSVSSGLCFFGLQSCVTIEL